MEKTLVQVRVLPEITGSAIALPLNFELPTTYETLAGELGIVSTKLSRAVAEEPVLLARKVYVVIPPVGSTDALVSFDNVVALLVGGIGVNVVYVLLPVSVCLICVPLLMNATGLTVVGVDVGPTTRSVATNV